MISDTTEHNRKEKCTSFKQANLMSAGRTMPLISCSARLNRPNPMVYIPSF